MTCFATESSAARRELFDCKWAPTAGWSASAFQQTKPPTN
jgi:hypothetical protein